MQAAQMIRKVTEWISTNAILGLIIALGIALRLWGIRYALPFAYPPDEPTYVTIMLRILKTGDLNPHWWFYPSLMFYLNAAALFLLFLGGRVTGQFATLADLPYPEILVTGVGKFALPSELLTARALTALFSSAAILMVYLIGVRCHRNKGAAWWAALLLAVSPTVVDHSHWVGPDIFAMFFSLVSAHFSIQIIDEPRVRNYMMAGIAAGLAIASKYNAGLILVPLLVVHFLHFGGDGWKQKEIYLGLFAAGIAFLIATPFALFDFPGFWEGVRFQVNSYSTEGHSGQEGNALQWYVGFLWESEGWISLLGALGGLYFLLSRSKKRIVLAVFPLIYFAFVISLLVRNARTIMQIIPFLDLLAAMFVVDVYGWLNRAKRLSHPAILTGLIAICALIVVSPLQSAIASDARLTQTDSRETARVWIDRNLPRASRIALEPYSPYVDRQHFMVEGFDGLIGHPPDWYVQNGFEYLVFSYGTYGRFYEDPARYPEFVKQYDKFFLSFPEVIRFNDNGYEIRILKTNTAALPAHRVAARFGIYSNWLEMVGYDVAPSRWQIGTSANFTFYWRSVQARREPLRLTVRLLDRLDREVAQSNGNLFAEIKSDGRWPEGVARAPWKIVAPINAAPGMYRLELDVDAGEIGRVPVLSLNREPISDKLFIAPFKISPSTPSQNELQSAHTLNVKFGDAISLLGYSMQSPALRPGDSLALTLYWKSAAKIDRDYTVFVHLIDSDGRVRAQTDAQPFGGVYPTSLWDTGEVVRDDYGMNLPRDLVPGTFKIELGLYEYPSLVRLSVMDADGNDLGDHLVLKDTIQVAR